LSAVNTGKFKRLPKARQARSPKDNPALLVKTRNLAIVIASSSLQAIISRLFCNNPSPIQK